MKELICYTAKDCPASVAFQALEGKWKLPLLYVLCENGTLRYGELRQALGITSMMLSNTLKELEVTGLIVRIQYSEIPPRVEYSLSDAGSMLVPIIHDFCKWGQYLQSLNEDK